METNLIKKLFQSFEDIKQEEDWIEFWSARDLQDLLWYVKWSNFENTAIEKAKISCNEAWNNINDHFADTSKPIIWGKWAVQNVDDYKLSRYACYLIAQNWDTRKQEIAFAQAYFAVQTRKQEIIEQKLLDFERLHARKKLTTTEKEFQTLAYERWVDWDWIWRIRSKGDTVLFWWKTTQDMKNKLWITSWPLADYLPAVTLKAKDLATEVTNHNMKHDNLYWEAHITQAHIKNNAWVRKFLEDSWIKPEELPAEIDLKKIERQKNSEEKKLWKKKK
jgi:DNA-damage-inducible protein D